MHTALDPRPVLVPARPLADLLELVEMALAEPGMPLWLLDALRGAAAEVRSRSIADVAFTED